MHQPPALRHKGWDQTLLAGPIWFNTCAHVLVWTGQFQLNVGDNFSLSGFMNQFSDFVWGHPVAFLVPTVPTGVEAMAGDLVCITPCGAVRLVQVVSRGSVCPARWWR